MHKKKQYISALANCKIFLYNTYMILLELYFRKKLTTIIKYITRTNEITKVKCIMHLKLTTLIDMLNKRIIHQATIYIPNLRKKHMFFI